MGFVWMLVLPLAFFLWQQYAWFAHHPSALEYYYTCAVYWGYMVTSGGLNGIGLSLLQMRESGFLKMYRFISGRTLPIVLGQILSLMLYTLLNVTIFTIVTAIMVRMNVVLSLLVAYIVCILCLIPIAFLFCWVPSLPARVESISPLLNILLGPLTYLAGAYGFKSMSIGMAILSSLNPVSFVTRIATVIFDMFHIVPISNLQLIPWFVVLCVFLVVGWLGYRNIRIVSSVLRT
jgi:ABC-2 type transport system permease protein